MVRKDRRRRTAAIATICVVVLLVVGAGAVATEPTTKKADSAVKATNAVNTGGQEGTNISIQNLSAPSEVRVGTDYTVSATIINRDDSQEIRRVSYQITGNVVRSKIVVLPANATETVQFNITGANTSDFPTGTFTHGIFADSAQATANLTLTAAAETTTPEETTPAETTTPGAITADVTFEDQTSNGSTVTVEEVTVPEGGFVVIHDRSIVEGEVIDSMVGESGFLDAGTHRNVTIQLDEPLNESQELVAVVYRDSNDNQEYDFVSSNRTADGPYTRQDSREAVNEIASITVEEAEQ